VRTIISRVLLAAALLPLACSDAWAISAGDLYRYCTSGEKTLEKMCGLYMTGFMNGLVYQQITEPGGPQKICLPEGFTGKRVKETFEGFMRDYPGVQNEPKLDEPGIMVGMALFRAFPCPKRQ